MTTPGTLPEPQRFVLAAKLRSYLGELDAAVAVLSEGLARHPDSAHLYRHRGEFLLTQLRLEEALADFARAEALLAGMDDEIDFYRAQLLPEMERLLLGRPAELLVAPTPVNEATLLRWKDAYKGTLKHSTSYHDALASYLIGDVARAARRFRETLAIDVTDDSRSASSNWLYLSLRRGGDHAAAAELIASIPPELEAVERSYADLLDLYAGRTSADQMEAAIAELPPRNAATRGYGLAAWLMLEGAQAQGEAWLRRVTEIGDRQAFGHLAATVDLRRLAGSRVAAG